MIKHIVVITPGYPTLDDPIYAFIRPVVCGIVDNGISCTVISPQSLTKTFFRGKRRRKVYWNDYSKNGNVINVLQPYMISFSNIRIGRFCPTEISLRHSLKKAIKNLELKPDVLYGHFWRSALFAADFSNNGEIPVFVASGESEISKQLSDSMIFNNIKYISGLISVSTKNLIESKKIGLADDRMPYIISPNAIDTSEFFVIDKAEARKKLNYPHNARIGIFVGAFSERKGILRVVKAASQIPDLKLILIGEGTQKPVDNNNILYLGRVEHSKLVTYLNAADFFILPTLAEGCCNAIVEAMACGLPIISSDLLFNRDILDEDNAILIDPNDIKKISSAMELLCTNDEMRVEMSKNSLKKSQKLTIEARVNQILDFIEYNSKGIGGEQVVKVKTKHNI